MQQPFPATRDESTDDAERTLVRPISFDAAQRERALSAPNALPPGTRLGEFEIEGVLGQGGFSVVYVAADHSLGRRVALKEYIPAPLASRAIDSQQVQPKSQDEGETFALGLRSFVNEAKLLARFDHPALVKVYRFWEANGTAYMVMPLYAGQTLARRLRDLPAPPGEAWLRELLDPLTDALAAMHAEHCFHRDVAPDNILLLSGEGDRPLLLDFGAARQVIGDATQALTAILKPGYAPIEQYADMPGLKQGPWTDVYALAAVVHAAIAGRAPPPSIARLLRDTYEPLASVAAGRYSAQFLQVIDRALSVQPQDRPPSMAALREALGFAPVAPRPPAPAPVFAAPAPPPAAAAARPAPPTAATASPRPAEPPRATPPVPAAMPRRMAWTALTAAVLAAALVFVWRLQSAPPSPEDGGALKPVPAAAPATPSAVVSPPAASPEAAARAALPPAAGAKGEDTGAAAPATSAFAPPRTGLQAEFARVLQAQDAGFGVVAVPQRARLRVDRDALRFSVTSAVEGHVYVLLHGPDDSLLLLYPNRSARDNRIRAGETLQLPQASWPLVARAPLGTERFLVVVAGTPRDLPALASGRAGAFSHLPTDARLEEVARVLADGRYGAAAFSIDVVP